VKNISDSFTRASDKRSKTKNEAIVRRNDFSKIGHGKVVFKGKDRLKCMYFNARSIVNKIGELELYIKEEDLDIVGVTETWLTEEILTSECSIEGYTLIRKDRKDLVKLRGGGVATYVKNNIPSIEREDLNEQLFPETVWVELVFKGEKTLLGVFYRPPDYLVVNNEAMYTLINKVGKENVVIMGDFNFPELKWASGSDTIHEHSFVTCLNDNFMEQLVDKPTRGENILDLVFCSDASFVQNLTVGEPFDTSDHQIIRFELVVSKEDIKDSAIVYNYFKADYNKIREYVKRRDWENLIDISDVEKSWCSLKNELLTVRNEFVPKNKRNKNKCKWVTKEVVRCRKAKKSAWNKYVQSNKNMQMYQYYVTKRKQCAVVNRNARMEFETKLADNIKQDSKSFYAYIRSKQRCREKVGPLKDLVGDVVSDDKLTADILNKYFASVFTIEDLNDIPEPDNVFVCENDVNGLNRIEINEAIVFNKLAKLNVNKSAGVDDLHAKLLFELREELVRPLSKLFNVSVESAIVPQDWRDANVTPLFKKGSRDKPENYRPISLTSIIGKILESIVKDNLVKHLESHGLIRNSQHGFRQGRSCLTNLLDFMEVVTQHLDDGQPVDLVYLDFAKAFDKVPFVRLIKKLECHGIGGETLQ
jgi:Reverse transcriptase (RNA-dependent DNA polymerase)/Endonuclease-reverse transcriptase